MGILVSFHLKKKQQNIDAWGWGFGSGNLSQRDPTSSSIDWRVMVKSVGGILCQTFGARVMYLEMTSSCTKVEAVKRIYI